MNLRHGFRRITLVLSLLSPPIVFLYLLFCTEVPPKTVDEIIGVLLLCFFLFFVGLWAVYGLIRWIIIPVVRWIIRGFQDVQR